MGWRYVLSTTEEWIKEKQEGPANLRKPERQEGHKHEQHKENRNPNKQQSLEEEHVWRRQSNAEDNTKHHDAYVSEVGGDQTQEGQRSKTNGQTKEESEYQKVRKKYSPQEIALLYIL